MSKKKLGLIIGITVAILIAVIIITVVIVNSNKNKISYSDNETYKVKVELPKDKEIRNKYKFIKNDDENSTEEINDIFADFAIVSEEANIEFKKKIYVFQNTFEYQNKYKDDKPGFENYKKYVSDEDINLGLYENVKELEINGTQAIQYNYDNTTIIVLNTDKIDTKTYIEIRIYPKNEEDIEELIKNEEIQSIINTIKFSKK